MSNHACGCCQQPYSPELSLEWDSDSGSHTSPTPCGWEDPDDAKVYSTKKVTRGWGESYSGRIETTVLAENENGECLESPTTYSGSASVEITDSRSHFDPDDGDGFTYSQSWNYTKNTSTTYNSTTGSPIHVVTGTASFTETETTTDGSLPPYTNSFNGSYDQHAGTYVGTWVGDGFSYEGAWNPPASSTEDTVYDPPEGTATTTEYSGLIEREEVSTADLDLTLPDDWTGESGSILSIDSPPFSISARLSRYRIAHQPTGTCYLKVWLQEVFAPEDGPPEDGAITHYTWNGTGNPCIPHPLKSASHEDNKIEGGGTTIPIPTENGTATVEILKWSYLPGYEPDISDEENPQPNGFPDPAWEPAAP